MRVAIGAVAGTIGGPAVYARELVRALAAAFPEDDVTVLTDRPDLFPEAMTIHVPLRSAWMQPAWDHIGVGRALRAGSFDLYHGTKGILPRMLSIPGVVTVHDLACYRMPETFSLAQRCHLRFETPSTIKRARAVVTDSQSSGRDLARLFPSAADRVEVIPLAAPSRVRPPGDAEVTRWKEARGIVSPCVGYLGTLQPRKNIDLLARAFLRAAGGRGWKLLIAGRLRPGYRPSCLDAGDPRIVYLGVIPDDEVALLLGALSCMVSPSSYEGFGFTFLEAMSVGCPVVGFANSSIPEIVGDAGLLLDETGVDQLAAAIDSVVTDRPLAADLSRRGMQRARLFSWTETARRTRAVYARVCEGPR